MMGTNICSYCGAHLDPGEKCDCRDENIATPQEEKDPDADKANQSPCNC